MFVVAEFKSDRQSPRRIEGAVTVSGNTVTVTHRAKGEGKDTVEVFETSKVSYLKGDAGFVVVNSNAPIAKVAGELITKNDVRAIKTEAGNVILNDVPGIVIDVKVVGEDSREARIAERASKVKVRPSRSATAPAETAAPARSRRAAPAATEEAPARPSRRRAEAPAPVETAPARSRRRPA